MTSRRRTGPGPNYAQDLEKFLQELIGKFAPKEVAMGIVNKNTIGLWAKAFTHITYSMDNYETLETIGDASLSIAFYDYITKSLPVVDDPKMYTELKQYYMSKHFQGQTSVKLGLTRYLRKDPVVPDLNSIAEDLFEAFTGAMYSLGNKLGEDIVGMQIGQVLANNFIAYIFNSVDIDLDRRHGSYKTQLETMAKKLGIQIDYVSKPSQHQAIGAWYTNTVKLEDLLSDLVSEGIIPPVEIKDISQRQNIARSLGIPTFFVLGYSNTGSQEDVQNESAKRALAFFFDVGISRDVADSIQREKLDDNIKSDVKLILGKYKFVKVRKIDKSSEDKGYVIYLLIGYDQNGNAETIVSLYEKKTVPFNDIRKKLYELGRKKLDVPNV